MGDPLSPPSERGCRLQSDFDGIGVEQEHPVGVVRSLRVEVERLAAVEVVVLAEGVHVVGPQRPALPLVQVELQFRPRVLAQSIESVGCQASRQLQELV